MSERDDECCWLSNLHPEDVRAPRDDDAGESDAPAVESRWLDEDRRERLELGTCRPDEWIISDQPVWSLAQWT